MRLFCALVFSPLCVCLLLKWKDGSAAQRPESIPLLAESLFDAPVPWPHWVDAGELAIRFQWAEPEFDASVTSRLLRSSVVNHSPSKVSLDRAILLSIQHALPVDTAIYGEGLQMLSQTEGTLEIPLDVGMFTDSQHYRLPTPDAATDVYGMILLASTDRVLAISFLSSHRFVGKIHLFRHRIEVWLDLEGIAAAPFEAVQLEDLMVLEAPRHLQSTLLAQLAAALASRHPPPAIPRDFPPSFKGWCSWYAVGPRVSEEAIRRAIEATLALRKQGLDLDLIQIDDGFQAEMGDWFVAGPHMTSDLSGLVHLIREHGLEPALWIAPFIASSNSRILRDHPDWFLMDPESGQPLNSEMVSFGGWRQGPWYVLDGSHPEAQAHFTHLFAFMRHQLGLRYFKLDALFWGMLHGGERWNSSSTSVEAFRQGMRAILHAAPDAWFVGANHPTWPSLGLLHASRLSGDVFRIWPAIKTAAREALLRRWQTPTLWQADPDVLLLGHGTSPALPRNEALFHASVALAVGGQLLSGDELGSMTSEAVSWLAKLLAAPRWRDGRGPEWETSRMQAGTARWEDGGLVLFLMNWDDSDAVLSTSLLEHCVRCILSDFWGDLAPSEHIGGLLSIALPPRTATVCVPSPLSPDACSRIQRPRMYWKRRLGADALLPSCRQNLFADLGLKLNASNWGANSPIGHRYGSSLKKTSNAIMVDLVNSSSRDES